jgi:hypothetical protein
MSNTPNGYDPRWIEAINQALADRGSETRITDITEDTWDAFIGPMCDMIEEEEEGMATYVEVLAVHKCGFPICERVAAQPMTCAKCGTQKPLHNMLEDNGQGAEAGKTFYYCSQVCLEKH